MSPLFKFPSSLLTPNALMQGMLRSVAAGDEWRHVLLVSSASRQGPRSHTSQRPGKCSAVKHQAEKPITAGGEMRLGGPRQVHWRPSEEWHGRRGIHDCPAQLSDGASK